MRKRTGDGILFKILLGILKVIHERKRLWGGEGRGAGGGRIEEEIFVNGEDGA